MLGCIVKVETSRSGKSFEEYRPIYKSVAENGYIQLVHLKDHFNFVTCMGVEGSRLVHNECVQSDDIDWFDMTIRHEEKKYNGMGHLGTNWETDKITKPKVRHVEVPSKAQVDRTATVINRSKVKLSQAQISLLEKGLKFVPTNKKFNMTKLLSDLMD